MQRSDSTTAKEPRQTSIAPLGQFIAQVPQATQVVRLTNAIRLGRGGIAFSPLLVVVSAGRGRDDFTQVAIGTRVGLFANDHSPFSADFRQEQINTADSRFTDVLGVISAFLEDQREIRSEWMKKKK